MKKTSILHLITTAKNASPFDVNMAFDAGYEKIIPYVNVDLKEVVALTQDAIFSRTPSGIKREALFFGGRDIHLALDMQKAARSAMFTPFEVSTFSDPSGAFTTAAAILARVDAHLKQSNCTLSQQTLAIFGAAGTVGSTAALIASRQGTKVQMVAHADVASMQRYVDMMQKTYDVQLTVVDGSSDAAKTNILQQATVAIAAGPAGVRILENAHFKDSSSLLVMADVNAVPPSGIAGIEAMTNGAKIGDTNIIGFGALAIGQLKYVTQNKLLHSMLDSEQPMHIDYHHAYEFACAHA